VIEASDFLQVEAGDDTVTVMTGPNEESILLFKHRERSWHLRNSGIEGNTFDKSGNFPLLRYSRVQPTEIWPDGEDPLHKLEPLDEAEYSLPEEEIARTDKFLDTYGGPYRDWIRRAVEIVIPVRREDDVERNGSMGGRPGLIIASFPQRTVQLGEVLTHEASHQHLHMMCTYANLCDPSDESRYYSPIKKADRSLMGLMLAYHAVGNMILYYKVLTDQDVEMDDVSVDRYRQWVKMRYHYEETLDAHRNKLTRVGNEVWLTLREQLSAMTTDEIN
jgi:HEXXH motif-containing protein